MPEAVRKKSPRAPSIALDEAIEKALKVYDKERRHPAPTEVVAQDLGYKNANNGAALATLASLRYYGLLERPHDGHLAVAKELEDYKFAPSEDLRQKLLGAWLRSPPIFADLLEKYETGLPSDANLKFDLIQRGFSPQTASSVVGVFRRSVGMAEFFATPRAAETEAREGGSREPDPDEARDLPTQQPQATTSDDTVPSPLDDRQIEDRIPVRLPGGRRAWLTIPTPFFTSDKKRLKAQIDLLLTEDEDEEKGA